MLNVRDSQIKALTDMIAEKAINRASDGARIMSLDGSVQEWLIDLRPILLDVKALDLITNLFWDEYESRLPFQVGGMEVAAVPLVTAILMKARERNLDVSGFIIRKERKPTGLGKSIEGNLTDDPIILVDDLMNSGGSLERGRLAIEQAGKKVNDVFVILNYENDHGAYWAHQNNITVNALSNLDPLDVEIKKTPWEAPKITYHIQWRFYEPGAFPYHCIPKSTPLVVKDRIYMGSDVGKMICVDRHTGEVVWKYDTKTNNPKGIWSSPAHHKGRIYFGAYNGIAYCLDAETGEEVWINSCCEFIGSSPLIVPKHNMMFLGLEHQRPRQKGSNAAFDLDTGSRVWERGQKKWQHGSATYCEKKDWVIWGNANHDVTAYDAKTGDIIWEQRTKRSTKYPPTVDEELGIVVATSFDGNIYILDLETGERKGAIQTNDICYTTALVTHGKIFAGSADKNFYIIDAETCEVIKEIECFSKVFSSPRLIHGHVVFGTAGGRIVELDPDSLEVVAYTQLPDSVTNAISVSDDGEYLYASTIMNELYSIQRTVL